MWTKTKLVEELSRILTDEGLCSGIDEATVVSDITLDGETIMEGDDGDIHPSWAEEDAPIIQEMIGNLGIEEAQARSLISKLNEVLGIEGDDFGDSDDGAPQINENDEDEDDQDSDSEYLEDGECELCDRYIKLTKHHLIPKETWARIQTKLVHAAEAKRKGELDKAAFLLGPGLENVLDALSTDKVTIRGILQQTCEICRQCHTAVHRTHSNMELALRYNTVDKLLADEIVSKFCRWASKQRAGKYKR